MRRRTRIGTPGQIIHTKPAARAVCATVFAVGALACVVNIAHADAGARDATGAPRGLDPLVLVGVASMLVAAKLGGAVFERFKQPAVLGELLGGMLLGALALAGVGAFESLKTDAVVGALAEIGVVVLLFEVGLESDFGELLKVGLSSLLVALAGTVGSFLLGWGAAKLFLPGAPPLTRVFVGAAITATSVGITARVLRDLGRLQTPTARIILGAAIIDDVIGLVVLAVMKGAVEASDSGAQLSAVGVAVIAAKAAAFLVGAVAVGKLVVPQVFRGAGKLEGRGVLLSLAVSICFAMAWAAAAVGLATIVGAFAAGLLLEEAHFEKLPHHTKHDLHELLQPVSQLLVPLFFVLVGLRVDLRVFARPTVLAFACALTLAAILGKQACALGVVERGASRLAVGLGMIPRGEVELIFAGLGATLLLTNAQGAREPVVSPTTYGAIVVTVVLTTLVTPPALKWATARDGKGKKRRDSEL
jgi:Kef-type K+ transport system membrane component KefB